MKVGDTIPVTIEGSVVAQATVEAVETDRVTLIVPATRVVMAVVTRISGEHHATPSKETIVDEVVRTPSVESGTAATEVAAEAPAEPETTSEVTSESTVESSEPVSEQQ